MPFEVEPKELKLQNLATLHAMEDDYFPNEVTKRNNGEKTFIAVSAPFRSGKTVTTDEVTRIEPRIQLINTSTTRLRKPSEDQPGFKTASEGITSSWFLQNAEQGNFANFSVIPGVDVYGTLAEDFPGEYSIGPFLPSSLNHLKRAGFKALHAVYLVTPADMWHEFATESLSELGEDKFKKRALESIDSAEYAIEHPDDFIFLENSIEGKEGINKLAQKICDIALNNNFSHGLAKEKAIEHLKAIKSTAQELALH